MAAHTLPRKLLAELAGTFAVVLIAVAMIWLDASMLSLPRAGFGPPQGPFSPLAIVIVYGIAYGAAVATVGRVSGGHFNPAVTVAHWVTHRLGIFASLLYIAAQTAGASAAAYILQVLPAQPWRAGGPLGVPVLAAGVTRAPALLIEAAMAFALVLALWATIVGRARPRYWLGGIVAGVVVAVASYLGAPYTGGVLNPARAFGPAFAARQWAYQDVYWVGPLAGAVAAASLYDLLFRRRPREDAALKGGATQGQPTPL